MLKRNHDAGAGYNETSSQDAPFMQFDLADIVGTLQRQWPLIVSTILVFMSLAVAYCFLASPRYTATTSVLIDIRQARAFQPGQENSDPLIDVGLMQSQIEIMQSESLALSVIRKLKLEQDPEFNGSNGFSLLGSLAGLFGVKGEPNSPYRIERGAVGYFLKNLLVKRVELSSAIEISYTSLDAAKSAKIANAIADEYLVNELDAKYEATKRASAWMQDRLSELRKQASESDAAVQVFKVKNNIVDTGHGLMTDQQVSDMSTQLAQARADVAQAKARLDRVQQIAKQDLPEAMVTDALKNDVITRLRAQYLDLGARYADLKSRYGATHQATMNLANQMAEIKKSIAGEVGQIAQTYQSDYEIAKTREKSIEDILAKSVDQVSVTSQAQIKLHDLESSSQSYRNLYDNFLQRYMETTQQQTFPINEARIITAASEPLRPSAPKTLLIVAGAAGLGLLMGLGAAFSRERLDNTFRTVADVESTTGMECLGILPTVALTQKAVDLTPANMQTRTLKGSLGLMRYVVDSPFTRFAETLRSAKVATDMFKQQTRVIGIISALPNEGKTTIGCNLAQLVSRTGHRAILIDGDLRNPSLTKSLAPEATAGLLEVISGTRSEAEVMWTDPVTGLHVIPAVVEGQSFDNAAVLSSAGMMELLNRLREHYDYIFVDLPPIAPVVDVRAAAHLIDGFLLVIEWGRTTKEIIQETVAGHDFVRMRSIGAILNKASPAMLNRLERYKGLGYNNYYRD